VAALTVTSIRTDAALDPAALVFSERRASERWFCWSEPDRGFELAGWGTVAEVVSRGPGRFADVQSACAEIGRKLEVEAGDGPVWVGGFAFDDEGGRDPQWSSLPPALMWLPRVTVIRRGEETSVTVVGSGPGPDLDAVRNLPMLDPPAVGRAHVESVRSPGEYEEAVIAAVTRINSRAASKLVLAREVRVHAPAAHDAAALFGALREAFPSCFVFCVGTPEAAFVGASPELLIRRSGQTAATVALAGSARRSADPAVDAHLADRLLASAKDRAEHSFVVNRIKRELDRHSVWVDAGAEPEVIRVANIQHLATPVRAQLADARSAVELAGLLHPTPAVGAEPRAAAAEIAGLEQLDRGWYAGAVGWMDSAEDGEFCVALRSALLRDRTAHLYAGAGIVADSEPAAELAETEVKLDALLPLLTG